MWKNISSTTTPQGAAIAAGYATRCAKVAGAKLLRNAKVAQRIEQKHRQRLEKLKVTADKVMEQIARIAFFDPLELFTPDGILKDMSDLDDETAAVVARSEVCELFDRSQGDQKCLTERVTKIELADKLAALKLCGRHLKLFTDEV